ncbi:paraquat-inducible protein A [Cobetia sp. D5]|uniref:paraquat-inducible protein A n=1 Tax=Cobetia TaxID=204286 RepID=UPI001CDB06AE|nr:MULTISPECIES: paraquat-inducible protein A [Cobetia]UBU49595.1 paraquat-inducible protein A [Cobetia amphilecti]
MPRPLAALRRYTRRTFETRDPPQVFAPVTSGVSRRRMRACECCDLVVALPALKAGERARCPRCDHLFAQRHAHAVQRTLALAMACLVMLVLTLPFEFIAFATSGISASLSLIDTPAALTAESYPSLAVLLILTIVMLPALYLLGVIYTHAAIGLKLPLPGIRGIARTLSHLRPWMMADVFLVGVMVSLVKIAGMADISFGPSFWAFCAFALLMTKTLASIDGDRMWFALAGEPAAPSGTLPGIGAALQGLASCHSCGLINACGEREAHTHCRRCGDPVHQRKTQSLQRTWAWLIAAAILYIPANLFPIMTTVSLGENDPQTIAGGIVVLWSHGDWPIAMVIFIASILVPASKMIAIAWLCISAQRPEVQHARARVTLYRITEYVGRWSMVDVFVVALLAALIQLGALMSVHPGPAALSFACVVVLTMLSALSFDPRLVWDTETEKTMMANTLFGDLPLTPLTGAASLASSSQATPPFTTPFTTPNASRNPPSAAASQDDL